MTTPNKLYFKNPAKNWEESLPLGNGRLGVMLKAEPCVETLQLNEESIWSGGPQDRINPDSYKYLNEVKKLIRDGKMKEAQELALETLCGTSFNERVYQTAGNFNIDFFTSQNYGIEGPLPPHKTPQCALDSYKSFLDLQTATALVNYTDENQAQITRKTWVSAVDDMIYMHVKSDKIGALNFRGGLDRGIWSDNIFAEDGFIFLEDSHGIPFCAGCGVVCKNGQVQTKGPFLVGKDCDEILFFIDIQTFKCDYKNIDKKQYNKLIQKNTWTSSCKNKLQKIKDKFNNSNDFSNIVRKIYDSHVDEYKSFYNRLQFELNPAEQESELSTPELLQNVNKNNALLVQQYYNFCRYLLLSSSRKPGILPATLQGIWNCYMDPPWGSKYTININLQMNYWAACMCNMAEIEESMFELLERTYKKGAQTAKKMYGSNGYVVHHNTDIWGDSAPQDCWMPGTFWVLGNAWLATHIYEHYEYTQNIDLLSKYYYLMHEACRFYTEFLEPCDLLSPDGKPYLVLNPSVSPENSYVTKAGEIGAITAGCQMDNMILEHLFTSCLKSAKILQDKAKNPHGKSYKQNEFKKDLQNFEYVLSHLNKPDLNKDGSLMEWNEEVEEVEPGHRHVSHLYGLFPGITINTTKNAQFMQACKKTLEKRLQNGGGHTGWSQAWILNFRASLQQGEEALEGLKKLLTHSTLPNLLDTHPPFQIDGNFGTLAAITRMIVQSQLVNDDELNLYLLPAIPNDAEWKNGKLFGVKTKGGLQIDLEWKENSISKLKIFSSVKNQVVKKVNIFENNDLIKQITLNSLEEFDVI